MTNHDASSPCQAPPGHWGENDMTETGWLACLDPQLMLELLQASGRASDRKLRLFACECCRRIWHLFPDQRCRRAVKIAAAFADGKGGKRLLRGVESVGEQHDDQREDVAEERLGYHAGGAIFQLGQERLAADMIADATSGAVACSALDVGGGRSAADNAKRCESTVQCHLLRDIFGNPFRPIAVLPAWLTPTVVSLATQIYQDRVFDLMPALGAALSDAGCTDAAILGHCVGPGPHVRGCFVLDLVLGKS